MGLLSPRTTEPFGFKSPDEAARVINIFLNNNEKLRLFDAIAEAVERFPHQALPFLVAAEKVYHSMENASRYDLYQKRTFDFGIQPGDKVLDIGSGHLPFPLATHLADLAIRDGSVGRNGIPFRYQEGKPVYECPVEHTPFRDKEFDFVYCSHVLEHSPDPAQACRELMRIAKRGYIETPTRGKDIFMVTAQASHHLNYVELNHDVLTFYRYEPWEMQGLGHDILLQMHCRPQTDRERAFSALLYLYPRQINTMLLWEDDFRFRVNFDVPADIS